MAGGTCVVAAGGGIAAGTVSLGGGCSDKNDKKANKPAPHLP